MDCRKLVTLKMIDAPLKAASRDRGSLKSPATTSTPWKASSLALVEDVSQVTARSADGEGDRERKWEMTAPPWLPMALRTTRRGFSEEMMGV